MKFLIFVLFFLNLNLNGANPQTIRVAPSPHETDTKEALTSLKVFAQEQKNVVVKEKVIIQSKKEPIFWQYISYALLFLLLLALAIIIKYKRNQNNLHNQEIFLKEKFSILDQKIKNKETFLSHVSHELRTPMTAIMGLTHLVLENELPKLQREYIQKIDNSAQHLIQIVNDVLDISKIQSGEFTLEKKEFNLNDIFDYILNIISVQSRNNNIEINFHVDENVPSHVVGDSLRLGQVLINLLANAVKFTQDGEVKLEVKQISNFADATTLEFTIADTGIGMSPKQLENVFQSFTQASTATSRKFGGTGLGLSISKQLVEMMGGSIHVKSEEGIGTQFIFNITFALKDAENKRQYRLPSTKLLNKKILLVDSVNKNILALIQAFSYFHYTTHSIPSFEEAILDSELDFDIIIINQNKLTKFAINKLNTMHNQETNSPKIIILSELHSSLSENILKELAVSAYLRTPFTQQSILNLIIDLYVVKHKKHKKINPKDKLKTLHGKKILVAEDNTLNHKVIQGLLNDTGIELSFVENGKEAVELITKNIKFDLILMDVNMPVMNGYEATQEIRKYKKYDSLGILALTADVMEESIQKAFESGMQGHITKPIIVDIFYTKIYEALKTNPAPKILKDKPSVTTAKEYDFLSAEVGLEHCNGDSEFYISILSDFNIMYKKSIQTLNNLCTKNKFNEARNMTRDIKDVALNIGGYDVCEKAAVFEYKCEKGIQGEWKKILLELEISLNNLFEDISNYTKDKH